MDVQIRELMPRDVEEVVALWKRQDPDDAPTEPQVVAWHTRRPTLSLVAWDTRGVIGAAICDATHHHVLGDDPAVAASLAGKVVAKLLARGEHHCRLPAAVLSTTPIWCGAATPGLKPLPASDDAIKDVACAQQG